MARTSGFESGELTDTAVQIMLALLRPRHGYAVMQFLGEASGGEIVIGPASLYTTLKKLLSAGLIDEIPSDEGKRPYQTTAHGRAVLAANIERRRHLVELADQVLTNQTVPDHQEQQ